MVTDTAWDLSEKSFKKGVVYKTHGLAEEFPVSYKTKVIFLFGCASDAALSVLKWSGKFGQHAKMYPTRTNGYENDKTTELFRYV